MLAWKFLCAGRVAPFSGVRWPEPGHGFVEGAVHACAAEDLPYWMDDELWLVELEGEVARARHQWVGQRGRLVARIEGWPSQADDFTLGCTSRARRRIVDALLGAGRDADADRLAGIADLESLRDAALEVASAGAPWAGYLFDVIRRRPYPALCAYNAANGAAVLHGTSGHDEERALQVASLIDRLNLGPF
jgi:hypothetical protein